MGNALVARRSARADAPGAWLVPHTASDTEDFTLDKSAPVISSLSGAPSSFCPRIRDGYKDNCVVTSTSSEAATATLTVKNSAGQVVRTITEPVPALANAFLLGFDVSLLGNR